MTEEAPNRELMQELHTAMNERGLLERGSMQDYWYSVFDGLVFELCPSLAEED